MGGGGRRGGEGEAIYIVASCKHLLVGSKPTDGDVKMKKLVVSVGSPTSLPSSPVPEEKETVDYYCWCCYFRMKNQAFFRGPDARRKRKEVAVCFVKTERGKRERDLQDLDGGINIRRPIKDIRSALTCHKKEGSGGVLTVSCLDASVTNWG